MVFVIESRSKREISGGLIFSYIYITDMKSTRIGILICTLCVVLGGCASIGSKFDNKESANSLNTKADKEDAVEYRKAADQGDAEAQYNLGLCYGVGSGVPKDEVEAVKWYRKAAEQGNAEAQSDLGNCYAHGTGVKMDEVEAVKWYRKAVDQGDTNAQYNLGFCYSIGSGVPKDAVMAAKWGRKAVKGYRKAAKQGNTAAQIGLGGCYAFAVGVPEDKVEAYAFYNLSDSRESTDRMAKEMTPEQIAAAKKRTKDLEKEFKK
jgi:TPR repeat protein